MSTQIINVSSKALGRDVQIGIILSDHEISTLQSVILLHGYNGTFQDMNMNLPLQLYADEYGLAIFGPSLGNRYYIDHQGESYSEFLSSESVNFAHSYIPNTKKPILAGISMGGYGALLVGSHHPDVFSAIISVSAALIAKDVMIGNPQVVGTSEQTWSYFRETFPVDQYMRNVLESCEAEIWEEEWNPIVALKRLTDVKEPPMIYLCCGEEDPLLFERNMEAVSILKNLGIRHGWCPIKDYGHVFPGFDIGLRWTFGQINQIF